MASATTSTDQAMASARDLSAGELDPALLDELRREFESNRSYRLMQNALTQSRLEDVALNRSVVTSTDHTFSQFLDDWTVTNQKKSGRCWMFAGLNLLRVPAMKHMNLKEFEFSQNYIFFWDKLERSNYFLEAIIDTADKPAGDRTVAWLLDHPLDDGGQWNMFVNVVHKYGLVPKSVMPETESSSSSSRMNGVLLQQLRQGAEQLRGHRADGRPAHALRAAKLEILHTIHRILSIHLGTPPSRFFWQWNDKDRKFHRDGWVTPREFAQKYIERPLHEYVCLVHDPRETSPSGRTFTVQYLGNVVGGGQVKYLNVTIDEMKQATQRTLEDGEPVWMGCDVGQQMSKELGLWDAGLYDLESVYDAPFAWTKASRLIYHGTQMTHAMLFTGLDVVQGKPRRWRVENSWGEDNGRKGFYVMNDSWFDEYMFEVAVRKCYLSEELQAAIEQEPIVLPPWDPMGALAG